jgi:Tol biopolymer transport system component/DNA-binding winged helix-turn-helix (wHTH) protein
MAFQFGTFEVNPRAGELRKHGVRIKLQDQPFRILLCLLENAGQVVTREQIQQKLWPDNTYVDYENAINSAMRKLREALNDSSDNPRFVETLPRRGYRFLAPVMHTRDAASAQELLPAAGRAEPQPGEPTRTSGAAQSQHRWGLLLRAAGVVAIIVAGAAFWIRRESLGPRAPLLSVPLTAFQGDERYVTFSPDGSQVAFSWNGENQDNSDIYVMLIGSGRPLRLTTDPAIDLAPAWSPDGKTIAFVRREGNQLKYVVMPSLGGPEREIAQLLEQHYPNSLFINPPLASWSPDGRWLVASGRGSADRPSALWLISVETGEKRQLTLPPATYWGDLSGAFSPDGRIVAFCRSDGVQAGDLYVLPLAADFTPQGNPQRLTKDGRPIAGISWTPQGDEVIFSSLSGTSWSLWRMAVSGSHTPVRMNVGEDGLLPSISRQGNRLAYTQSIPDTDIWRIDLSEPREPPVRLIASTRLDTSPQYSPDGKRITFESSRSGKQEVWVCDADGSNPTQVVTIGRSGSPRWSPDGQSIAFDSNVEGHWQIYIVSAQGGRPRRLTNNVANDVRPSWSPDGKWIYFGSNRSAGGHRPQVWRVPAGGGEPVQITRNGGYTPFASRDGKTIYFFKDDSRMPSLWKAPAEGGEEVEVLDEVTSDGFALATGGIYFIWQAHLQFLDFSTGLSKTIVKIEKPSGLGVAVSPDNQWLLLTERNEGSSDLMLVENFR